MSEPEVCCHLLVLESNFMGEDDNFFALRPSVLHLSYLSLKCKSKLSLREKKEL